MTVLTIQIEIDWQKTEGPLKSQLTFPNLVALTWNSAEHHLESFTPIIIKPKRQSSLQH